MHIEYIIIIIYFLKNQMIIARKQVIDPYAQNRRNGISFPYLTMFDTQLNIFPPKNKWRMTIEKKYS